LGGGLGMTTHLMEAFSYSSHLELGSVKLIVALDCGGGGTLFIGIGLSLWK